MVYVLIALLLVGIVAYMVYSQCRPDTEETFINNDPHITLRYQSAFDKNPLGLESNPESGIETSQHINETRVSFMESIDNAGQVKYGIKHVDSSPMFALQCMWGNTESHPAVQNSPVQCDLSITLFIHHAVGPVAQMTIRSFNVVLSIDKTYKSFIPINGDIIDRKIAHNAKIVRVCIERTDNNNVILGVEKVCVVKYEPLTSEAYRAKLPSDDTDIMTYTYMAGKKKVNQEKRSNPKLGNRLEMGVMLCDPVCLVSQSFTPTKDSRVHFGLTSSMIADVAYGRNQPTYGNSGTHAFKVYVSFVGTDTTFTDTNVTMYFGNLQTSDQTAFNAYYNATATSDQTATPQTLLLLSDTYKKKNHASEFIAESNLHANNVAKAALFNVQPNVVYEVVIAMAEQQNVTAFTMFAFTSSNDNVKIKQLSYSPFNGGKVLTEPYKLLSLSDSIPNEKKTFDSMINTNHSNICADHIVDADATILRFNNKPRETTNTTNTTNTPNNMSECGIFRVNDGLVFSGSLLAPHNTGMTHANHLCSLSLQFDTNRRLVIKLTRDGVYLYEATVLGDVNLKAVPVSISANDVCWYIYIHKNTFGVCINDTVSFSNLALLQTMYNSTTPATIANGYPVLTNVALTIDPAMTIESRVMTALAMKPTLATMKQPRSDTVNLLQNKASLLYTNTGELKNTNTVMITSTLIHPQSTIQFDSGFSLQCELTKTLISRTIEQLSSNMYTQNKKTEATLFKTNTVKVVLAKQKNDNPSPLLYDICVYFTSDCGEFVKTPRVIGSHKLFEQTEQYTNPRVIIKYSNYKKAERVCVFRYDKDMKNARLFASYEHTLAPKVKPNFDTFTFNQHLLDNIVCGSRTQSTNCNPYNTRKNCDCSGRVNADPSSHVSGNPPNSNLQEALSDASQGYGIDTPSEIYENDVSIQSCMKLAYSMFGTKAVAAIGTIQNAKKCSIADRSQINIIPMENSVVFQFPNMADEGMRLVGQTGAN